MGVSKVLSGKCIWLERSLVSVIAVAISLSLAWPIVASELEGLRHPATVIRDGEGIPHVFALAESDAYFLLGYVHAEDRFFQMDFFRHVFEGTLTELLGPGLLSSDAQFRRFNLRSVAEASFSAHSTSSRRLLTAYADGVNAYLANNPLPIEYSLLEVTLDSLRPWSPSDGYLLLKGFSASSWLDLSDLNLTLALDSFSQAGSAGDFDGAALFFEDVYRLAPTEPTTTVPAGEQLREGSLGASSSGTSSEGAGSPRASQPFALDSAVLDLARQLRDEIAAIPTLHRTLEGAQRGQGSNWWLLDSSLTRSRVPILANDPHQFLSMPPVIYEAHLKVLRGGGLRDVSGVTFAGIPAVPIGCTDRVCWGATNNSMDVTDTFAERVMVDAISGRPTHTIFQGNPEPITVLEHSYRANRLGDGIPDNLEPLEVAPSAGGESYHVPRRNNGPLLSIGPAEDGVAAGLSVQYIGWSPNLDLETFIRLARARKLRDFDRAMRYGDGFLFNMGYADVDGNIAYFASGEVPLRDDLQNLERVDGAAPFLIRDGTGQFRNEWLRPSGQDPFRSLPYEILPREEMPQAKNPAQGYLNSSNNDPMGGSLDNDPFNELRGGGGVYYLNRSFVSLRAAQVERAIEENRSAGRRFSGADIRRLQADSRMLDAEILAPYLVDAFDRGLQDGVSPQLAALAADPAVAEAVERLAAWDFSTPTGITAGYDPGDDPEDLPLPSLEGEEASVATTIFSVWRGQLIRRVIDQTLDGLGLGAALPPDRQAYVALLHQLRTFETSGGVGASGVSFFEVPGVESGPDARDIILLETLRASLDLLAGPSFQDAFGGSPDQDDYRWGLLHRITIPHPLAGPFNVPPAGGFTDLGPQLPGISRGGGFESIDTGAHSTRAADDQSFTFLLAAGRRGYSHLSRWGIRSFQILPGGQSGDPTGPEYTLQLDRWLTNQYAPVRVRTGDILRHAESYEVFYPAY
ncbi:MAG: penicillin acylase family protein [Deltaproteobacteria bacterium]|nr:penicillin acylase family protein [Deltaproteobacteria bacterium]